MNAPIWMYTAAFLAGTFAGAAAMQILVRHWRTTLSDKHEEQEDRLFHAWNMEVIELHQRIRGAWMVIAQQRRTIVAQRAIIMTMQEEARVTQ